MKKMVAILILGLFCLVSAEAKELKKISEGPVDGLSIKLSTEKKTIILKKPLNKRMMRVIVPYYTDNTVRLTFEFVNSGKETIKLCIYDLLFSSIQLNVEGSDNGVVTKKHFMLKREMAVPTDKSFVYIKPGETYKYTYEPRFPGALGDTLYKILEEGICRISVSYAFTESRLESRMKGAYKDLFTGSWTGAVKSNTVELKVTKKYPGEEFGLKTELKVGPAIWSTEGPFESTLLFKVTNITDKEIRIPPLSPEKIEIKDSQGNRLKPGFRGADKSRPLNEKDFPLLKPGETHEFRYRIGFGKDGKVHMAEITGGWWQSAEQLAPGTYTVAVKYSNKESTLKGLNIKGSIENVWTGSFRTNALRITVTGEEKTETKIDEIF